MQINPVLANPDNWSYCVHDHQGNTRVVLDDAGAVKSWYDYYPYGLIQRASIAGSDARFKFTGKEFDSEDDFDMYYIIKNINDFLARLSLYYDRGIFATPPFKVIS